MITPARGAIGDLCPAPRAESLAVNFANWRLRRDSRAIWRVSYFGFGLVWRSDVVGNLMGSWN